MKRNWIITLILLIVIGILCAIYGIFIDNPIVGITGMFFFFFSFLILLIVKNPKFYNAFLYIIPIGILGLLFKTQQWIGGGAIITLGFGICSICGLFMAFKLIFQQRNNKFITRIGFIINLVFTIDFAGMVFKTMHWYGGSFLVYLGTGLYIICLLALIFLLPNSNYHKWSVLDKKYFIRAMVIPIIFLFILTIWFNFSNPFKFKNFNDYYWNMEDYKLEPKEGLQN
jgi:hypothetical protein